MIYNFKLKIHQQQARERLEWLIDKGKRSELKEVRGRRTTPQNAYLHLLIGCFALEFGEEMEFIKFEIFKKEINSELFKSERKNPKSGKVRLRWKSSAELNTKEMTDAIDRFKNWSVKKTGFRLPDANEQDFLDSIKNELDRNKQWL